MVLVIVVGIVGYAGYLSVRDGKPWDEKLAGIDGVTNFRETDPDLLKPAQHAYGQQTYEQSPPVGGTHNPTWQTCMGDVYTTEIAEEHAIHSLEHGAVWVTYRPDTPQEQVTELAERVRGKPYTLMSPYPGLDKPISLQAWGFQLKVDDAGDKRIDEFLTNARQNASVEPGAACSGGSTMTGNNPPDLNEPQQGEMGG